MSNKTIAAYCSVFRYIHENILPLDCQYFMVDYEVAVKRALETVVPGIDVRHCWFHHNQANKRNVKKLGKPFTDYLQNDEQAKRLFKKLLCLPLLPADEIVAAFADLKLEVYALNSANYNRFMDYYERQWIQRVFAKFSFLFLIYISPFHLIFTSK